MKINQKKCLLGQTLFICFFFYVFTNNAFSQCSNSTQYPANPVSAPSASGVNTSIDNCIYAGDYAAIANIQAASTYQFTTNTPTDFVTIKDAVTGSNLAFGTVPVSWTAATSNNLEMHINVNAACDTESSCREGFVECTSCGLVMPPPNDDCLNAEMLTVADPNCNTMPTGTLLEATASIADPTTCGGTADDDVWFAFVATHSSHDIELLNVAGSTSDLEHEVLSGSCGSLTSVLCSPPNSSTVTGLTPGNTYFIRVYSWTATPGQTSTFNICIAGPPPAPANDECSDALILLPNSGDCDTLTSATIEFATESTTNPTSCTGTANDDVWFAFTATNSAHSIDLLNILGSATSLNHEVLSGTCGALSSLYCSEENSSVATNFIIGNIYYVRVYSWTATPGQNTSFDVCLGLAASPPANDDCLAAIALAVNTDSCTVVTSASIELATTSTNDPTTCAGTADDDTWFSFTATNSTHEIALLNLQGSTVDVVFEILAGSCGSLSNIFCSEFNTGIATNLNAGTNYFLRIYSYTATPDQNSTFDICITTPPACPDPVDVFVDSIGLTTIDVNWTSGGGTVINTTIEICPAGTAPGGVGCISVSDTDGSPAHITGLTGNCTFYDVYVQEDCDNGNLSNNIGPITFQTDGPVPDSLACDEQLVYPSCAGANYEAYENINFTVCPGSPTDTVSITFTYFDLESSTTGNGTDGRGCWDYVEIRDDGTSLGTYCSEANGDGDAPFNPIADLSINNVFTSSNAGTCLSVVFISDINNHETGFAFEVSCLGSSSCPPTLLLEGPVSSGTYAAQTTVTSTGTITASGNVIFEGNCVQLNNGFEVETGAEFLGHINPCSSFAPEVSEKQK